MIPFFLFVILSSGIFGTTVFTPVLVFGFNIHFIDVAFLLSVAWGWWKRQRGTSGTIDHSVAKDMRWFLLYSTGLLVFSVYTGVSVNNAIRFFMAVLYLSLYFFIPYLITARKRLTTFFFLMVSFLVMAYLIILFQNLTGWKPSSSQLPTDMSYTMDMGGIYRTYNPVQQWLVAAASFSVGGLFYSRLTGGRLIIFLLLLMFIALTFTRNLYLGFIVVNFLLFIRRSRTGAKKLNLGFIIGVILVVAVILVGIGISIPVVRERFQSTFLDIENEGGTFQHRLLMFAVAYQYMHNIFIGGGFGVLEVRSVFGSRIEFLIASVNSGSDSGLVHLIFRFGLIGAALFSAMSVRFVRTAFRRADLLPDSLERRIIIGAAVYTILIWVQSFASNVLLDISNAIILVTFWAVSDAVWSLSSAQKPPVPQADRGPAGTVGTALP